MVYEYVAIERSLASKRHEYGFGDACKWCEKYLLKHLICPVLRKLIGVKHSQRVAFCFVPATGCNKTKRRNGESKRGLIPNTFDFVVVGRMNSSPHSPTVSMPGRRDSAASTSNSAMG